MSNTAKHMQNDEILFSMKMSKEVSDFTHSLIANLTVDSIVGGGVFGGIEPLVEGHELSVGDKEIIAGRVVEKVIDILTACIREHLISSVEFAGS